MRRTHAYFIQSTPTPVLLLSSVFFSLCIIRANRYLFVDLQLPYVWTLASLNYSFLGVAVLIMAQFGKIGPSVHVPILSRLFMAAIAVLANSASNVSLKTNSVPTYQLFKLLVIPSQVFMYKHFFGKRYTTRIYLALILILIGVALATGSSFEGNAFGGFVGMISVGLVSIDTVCNGELKRFYNLSSVQFNSATALLRAIMCAVTAIIFEGKSLIADLHQRSREPDSFEYLQLVIASTLASCLAAVGVNIVAVAIIGRTTAVGYQVLGHVKTMVVLLSGGLAFLNVTKCIGIAIALSGSIWYAEQKRKLD